MDLKTREIINFVSKCDRDLSSSIYDLENIRKAKDYIKILKNIDNSKKAINIALIDKLNIIIKQISIYYSNIVNVFNEDSNISDYVISLIKAKHLTNPKLIARCAYIELSKYLYYDISCIKINDERIKNEIVNTPIDEKNSKIFSYVVCSQYYQLYSYILSHFGIKVKKMRRNGEYHTWGEIDLSDDEIIIVDATDYINSSIDLGNAKSLSPTRGFLVLPSRYSGIKLQEVYTNPCFKNTLDEIMKFYEANREFDISLGYINNSGYPHEKILRENEDLFSRSNIIIQDLKEASNLIIKIQDLLLNTSIPNNIDGYEIFSYYHMFIRRLPMNIRGNISMRTLYVDTYDYKQTKLRRKYLQTDREYLKYLRELVYSRYCKCQILL